MAPTNFANATPQTVSQVLSKLSDPDPDLRFMSLTDLKAILHVAPPTLLQNDYNTASRVVEGILKSLRDTNVEVQNVAIQCIKPLTPKLQPQILQSFVDKMSMMATDRNDNSTIPAMACRAVIEGMAHPASGTPPSTDATAAYKVLIDSQFLTRVLSRLDDHKNGTPSSPKKNEVDPDVLEILVEVVTNFGTIMGKPEIVSAQHIIVSILDDEKVESITKKRAIHALSILARYATDMDFSNLISHVIESLRQPHLTPVQRKMYITILTSLARAVPERFGHYLKTVCPFVVSIVGQDELDAQMVAMDEDGGGQDHEIDAVREAAFLALEAFVSECPINMRFFTNEVIASGLRYLAYDPNYNDDESDDEVEEEDDGMGSDDEFDGDDAFDDEDDDPSWKLRRGAAKVLRALIEPKTNSDLLEDGTLYTKVAPALVNRFKDRDQNARLDIIETMSLLVSRTGEGPELAGTVPDQTLSPQAQPQANSRKRRRDSSSAVFDTKSQIVQSTGLTSPVIKPVPSSGPRADLAKLSPQLVKAITKQLKGKELPTKQAILYLLANLAAVLPGGLSDSLCALADGLVEAVNGTGANATNGVSSSGNNATVATLRLAALHLICKLCETHSSRVLVPMMPKLIPAVITASEDRYTKLAGAGISTVEELIKTLTPPRAKSGTATAELQKLYKLLMDRINSTDVDSEIRAKAIHALGVLLARATGDEKLLSNSDRAAALDLLLIRIRNETSRLAAVRAIDTIATLSDGNGLQSGHWVAEVCTELTGQFRKSDRALRGASLGAVKNLLSTQVAKSSLEKETIKMVVEALIPLFNTEDLHLLGPALLVTANLVTIDVSAVVTEKLNGAICGLLLNNLGGAVLDALLVLVQNIGTAGAGKPLMQNLLQKVGINGDPAVTGRTIGTLAAVGGSTTGVTAESFKQELKTQKADGNKALALSVLGEIALRVGPASGIQPEDFVPYFSTMSTKLALATAVAFGHAATGDIKTYLPWILKAMQSDAQTQYLLLHSIKEILVEAGSDCGERFEHADMLWEKITHASLPEDNKAVGAECMGRLVVINPKVYLPKLHSYILSDSSEIRAMAYQALRYTLPDTSAPFYSLLKSNLVDMLVIMLQDTDLQNARLALTTLNSATHNKPEIVLKSIDKVMPMVLDRSVVKKEFIREISLGPFKHLVDDALDTRKSAYEVLYAFLEIAYPSLNLDLLALESRVVAGLGDDREIFSLCSLMLKKLLKTEKAEVERRLDDIAESLRKILGVKMKDNAVKQEIEKQDEAVRGALRICMLLMDKFPQAGMREGVPISVQMGEGGVVNNGDGALWRGFVDGVVVQFQGQLREIQFADARQR